VGSRKGQTGALASAGVGTWTWAWAQARDATGTCMSPSDFFDKQGKQLTWTSSD
jgi:hypothetical protein